MTAEAAVAERQPQPQPQPQPPQPQPQLRVHRRWWLVSSQTVIWAFVCVAIIGPLIPLVYTSFLSKPYYLPGGVLTLDAYKTLFDDPEFWSAVKNTLIFSVLATAIGLTIGSACAVLCSRTNMPGRRLYSVLLLAPAVVSPLGLIVGWFALYSDSGYITGFVHHQLGLPVINLSSLVGMSLLGGSFVVPVVFLVCRSALATNDSSLEDAARSAGAGPLRTLFSVTVPMLRPALLNSGVLVFALGVENMGVPLFLGAPSHINFMASYLYQQWTNADVPDPPFVSAGAVLFLLFATLLVLVRRVLLGQEERFVANTSRGGGANHPVALSRGVRILASCGVGAFILLSSVLPILGLVVMSSVEALTPLTAPWHLLTGRAWRQVATDSAFHSSIMNSLIVAAVGGALTVAVVAVVTVLAHRSRFALRGSLSTTLLYPRSIPGVVLGIGFFWSLLIVNVPGEFLRNSIWGVMAVLCVHSVTLAYFVIYPSLLRVNAENDRAAQAVGAGWWRTTFTVTLPAIRPALIAAYVLMFAALLNDYDPALFLTKPNTQVLGVTMLQYWQQGFITPVAALSVVQITLVVIALGLGALIARRGRKHA